jgi:predicted transcriptional regulator
MKEQSIFSKGVLPRVFGDNPRTRVITMLMTDHSKPDYTKQEISVKCGITRQTLHMILPDLMKSGLVYRTRKENKSERFSTKLGFAMSTLESFVDDVKHNFEEREKEEK